MTMIITELPKKGEYHVGYETCPITSVAEHLIGSSALALTEFDVERLGLKPSEVWSWDILGNNSMRVQSKAPDGEKDHENLSRLRLGTQELQILGSALTYYADTEDEALNKLSIPHMNGNASNSRLRRLQTDIAVAMLGQIEDFVEVRQLWIPDAPKKLRFGF